MKNQNTIPSSFRDPSGFLFLYNGELFRQINNSYKDEYDFLKNSGLYEKLVQNKLLIQHKEVENVEISNDKKCYKIIKPEKINFISYPYEWSFTQFKQAALTTLKIQKIAFEYGMTLKDASAYNVQFLEGKPIFIDTLSFEKYHEGQIWKPYRQFCQHFLAPLALISNKDIRLNQLLRIYIDGIPLDLTSDLLGKGSRFSFSLLSHIHLHAKSQKHYENKQVKTKEKKIGKNSFIGLIESLYSGVEKMKWTPEKTEWGEYYSDTNYSEVSFNRKKEIISKVIDEIKPNNVWDLGANKGIFSRIASDKNIETISFDIDPIAVEKNYLEVIEKNEKRILPLILDLTNPSPGLGWENVERDSLINRGPSDLVFALALIHHLSISNNLPFTKIVSFFKRICKNLIIEFVPKSDSQVQRLLSTREDIFDEYNLTNFQNEFSKNFVIKNKIELEESKRIFFVMENKTI